MYANVVLNSLFKTSPTDNEKVGLNMHCKMRTRFNDMINASYLSDTDTSKRKTADSSMNN